jgi:succinate dehydrogenase hydrophobic anchor subunit
MALKGLSNWLYTVSTGWVALVALLVFFLFSVLVLPGQSSQAEAVSGESGSPDMSFFYQKRAQSPLL